jgi:RimJ/RimL family protein N-acetyltransferase
MYPPSRWLATGSRRAGQKAWSRCFDSELRLPWRTWGVALFLLAMVLRTDPEVVVGRIGFHGPADDTGMLEIGYEVFPPYRRKGYA